MQAASPPEYFGYYFQIPENAEVKRVPISMLSSSVQQRITRLGDCSDYKSSSYVIVVSPITKQKFLNSHRARMTEDKEEDGPPQEAFNDTGQPWHGKSSTGKEDKWLGRDDGTFLVPVRCFRDTAMSILQLSQTSNEEKLSSGNESPNFSDPLVFNLQMIKMKATALCMYKNMMYLLPESKKRNRSDGRHDGQEKVRRFEDTESDQEAELTRTGKWGRHSLGCVRLHQVSYLRHQQQDFEGKKNSANVLKPWNKDRRGLPGRGKFTNASPSSESSTENGPQISFCEHSGRQIKRNMPYISNEETSIKKIHLSGSDTEEDSYTGKKVLARSPQGPHSPCSSVSSQESPPDLDQLSPSSLLEEPPMDLDLTCGIDMSPSLIGSSPSEFSSPEVSHEPDEVTSSGEPPLMFSDVTSDHASSPNLDDTTRDERAQRLRDRVREYEKIIENMQQKEDLTETVSVIME